MHNFSWLVEGVIAGMERPGSSGLEGTGDGREGLESDLKFLRDRGVQAIVSLTEESLEEGILGGSRFDYLHTPIADMTPPTVDEIERVMSFVEQAELEGKGVAIHCATGKGRTGVMLACYLVRKGESTGEAVKKVRQRRPGSIETADQELAVFDYERALRNV